MSKTLSQTQLISTNQEKKIFRRNKKVQGNKVLLCFGYVQKKRNFGFFILFQRPFVITLLLSPLHTESLMTYVTTFPALNCLFPLLYCFCFPSAHFCLFGQRKIWAQKIWAEEKKEEKFKKRKRPKRVGIRRGKKAICVLCL